ncbi:MAG: hypothetical protein QM811_28770 [Pirellulales bacterium]
MVAESPAETAPLLRRAAKASFSFCIGIGLLMSSFASNAARSIIERERLFCHSSGSSTPFRFSVLPHDVIEHAIAAILRRERRNGGQPRHQAQGDKTTQDIMTQSEIGQNSH